MFIKNINNQAEWDGWLAQSVAGASFAQSWAWGDILISEGKKVERLAVAENGQILAQAQVVYMEVIFGWQYAFCPRGPVVSELGIRSKALQLRQAAKEENVFSSLLTPSNCELRIYELFVNYLKAKKCVFFRIEPDALLPTPYSLLLKKTIDINPAATLILDLKKSEEELLAGMQQKTRYNIHLAEKKELKIKNTPPFIPPIGASPHICVARSEKDIKYPFLSLDSQIKGEGQGVGLNLEVFWELMTKTGQRDKFGLHHKSHYEAVLKSPMVYQLTAYESDKVVACAVFANFAGTFTYLYGASDYEYRNLMAPYLLQWAGIKMGKSFGCERYDFFGVAPRHLPLTKREREGVAEVLSAPTPPAQPEAGLPPLGQRGTRPDSDVYEYDHHHQYAGVTRFKLGFGGAYYQSAGTWDLVIDNKKYKIYNILRRLRRWF